MQNWAGCEGGESKFFSERRTLGSEGRSRSQAHIVVADRQLRNVDIHLLATGSTSSVLPGSWVGCMAGILWGEDSLDPTSPVHLIPWGRGEQKLPREGRRLLAGGRFENP